MTIGFEIIVSAATCALVVISSLVLLVKQTRLRARVQKDIEALAELLTHTRREAHSAVAYGSDVGKRLRKAEKEIATLTERLSQIELHGDARSFDRAINVARQGADAGKLVSNFGMSKGEAELVSLLHGQSKAR